MKKIKKIEIGKYGIPQETEDRIRTGIKAEEKITEVSRKYQLRWPDQYRKDKEDACLILKALIADGWSIESFIRVKDEGCFIVLKRLDL